jgi:23S rRNA pseudouridine1911/1915/1917 synthase
MPTLREILPESLDGERVDRLVAMVSGRSRAEAGALVEEGAVTIDGVIVTQRSVRARAAQELVIELPELAESTGLAPDPSVELDLVHVDDGVIVVDKPPGLVVHPGSGNDTGTLIQGVVAAFPEVASVGEPDRPGVVHRIDKGTSGLLVVARTAEAYESLVDQFGSRSVDREYLALCWGLLDSPSGMIDAPIGRAASDRTKMAVTNTGREARTRFDVQSTFTDPTEATLLSCRLETGRTHQIRVHLAAIGHPIVGDRQYGGARSPIPCERPWLHATRLGFVHPATGDHLEFTSALPADLAEVLDRLR